MNSSTIAASSSCNPSASVPLVPAAAVADSNPRTASRVCWVSFSNASDACVFIGAAAIGFTFFLAFKSGNPNPNPCTGFDEEALLLRSGATSIFLKSSRAPAKQEAR
ncbi:hypothetical protein DsansV1_C32g0222841 [Dioscorea sansibarensis]